MFVYISQKGNGIYEGEILAVAVNKKLAIETGLEKWLKEFVNEEVKPAEADIKVVKKQLLGK